MKKILSTIIILLILSILCSFCVFASDIHISTEEINCLGDIKDTRPAVPDSESSLLPSVQTMATSNLPSSVDLSKSQYFPPVGDQGYIGSCAAWATTYYQFGFQVASQYSLDVSSTSNRFSPRWVYNIINSGIDNGSNRSEAYQVLSAQGAVRYSQFTPTGVETTSEYRTWYLNENALENALKYRISKEEPLNYSEYDVLTPITSYNSANLYYMKTFLTNGQILAFSTDFDTWDYRTLSSQSDSSLNGQYVCIKQYDANNERDGHSMAIVGYNDNITYDLNGNGTIQNFERGAFKIVNSHGNTYKNNGFVWVMYDALNQVSNASNQNVDNRNEIIEDYKYNVIAVKEYTRELIVKVTLNQSKRNQIKVRLATSSEDTTIPNEYTDTMLAYRGGSYNFAGTSQSVADDATFVFDYGDLYNLDVERGNYYICVTDQSGGTQTIVKNIEIIDSTGKIVVEDTVDKTVSGTTKNYRFKLGAVGDVNNDSKITAADATLIQKYIANSATLSNEDLLVADVNADNKVTTSDATAIQKYVAKIISEFDNGKIVSLT